MGDVTVRVNLKTASFPLLSELSGQSVVVKKQDQNYIPNLAPKESVDSVMGIPQVMYAHNVMPNDSGYQSVAHTIIIPDTSILSGSVVSSQSIIASNGETVQLVFTTTGKLYTFKRSNSDWVEITTTPPAAGTVAGKLMSVAYVSGVTYIYFSGVGCYTYDYATNATIATTLTGLTASTILFIVAARGYLLAFSTTDVAWSSTITATDFTPSLTTGAGGGALEAAKGVIVFGVAVTGGVIIFTANNAVAAIASDNPRYPFNFVEIIGSGGLSNTNFVSTDSGTGTVYAYTTSGLQTVTLKQATPVFPEVTDFLSGSEIEDFNTSTLTLSSSYINTVLEKRLVLIASRYLVLSYGVGSLSHALVYDLVYKQWGKLKIAHADCFEFTLFDQSIYETPRKSIGFCTTGGKVTVVNFELDAAASDAVLVLGKFQYVRDRMFALQMVEVENVRAEAKFALYDFPTLDGKTFLTPKTGYLQITGEYVRVYRFHVTGKNHTLALVGSFNAVSLQITGNITGAR